MSTVSGLCSPRRWPEWPRPWGRVSLAASRADQGLSAWGAVRLLRTAPSVWSEIGATASRQRYSSGFPTKYWISIWSHNRRAVCRIRCWSSAPSAGDRRFRSSVRTLADIDTSWMGITIPACVWLWREGWWQ